MDIVVCSDKEEAKRIMDEIGMKYILDWEFIDDGKVKIFVDAKWKTKAE